MTKAKTNTEKFADTADRAIRSPGSRDEDRWVVTVPLAARQFVPVGNLPGRFDKDPAKVKELFRSWIKNYTPSATARMPDRDDVWTYSFPTQEDAEKFSKHWCARVIRSVAEFDRTEEIREIIE